MIKEIRIENYKSIQKLKLELGRVTVLIGENGCGKSNILEAIAFAAAAADDKLDNEFLAPKGIRETKPKLMRSAFDKDNIDKEIKISMIGDEKIAFHCNLQNDNDTYSKWNKENKKDFELFTLNNIKEDFLKEIEQKIDEELDEIKKKSDKERKEYISFITKEFLLVLKKESKHPQIKKEMLYIFNYLIYSPEYQCLRKFREEGQIRPLGINGEGLFKLLQVLSSDKEKIDEIKERLKLIGWFKDFKIPDNLSIGEKAIQIEDRYLDQELSFDQRSTNEGFLFLLFYFCLFISSDTPKFFAIDNIDASFNPKLCRRLIKELTDLAKKYDKQVIFTTHNPAILDGLNLDDDEQRLFIVSRNRSGYTKIKRFLKPETPEGEKPVRMSEAFLRGYIGGLPKNF